MLFNSIEFIFVFLPLTIALFFIGYRLWHREGALWVIVIASLAFYGWWEITILPLLICSILGNFGLATVMLNKRRDKGALAGWTSLGIAGNLLVLGWFKYAGFLTLNLNAILSDSVPAINVLLPIGISFYTFQQIAFLVDVGRGEVDRDELKFSSYAAFVCFFPQLIAGPIVHHKEVMGQYSSSKFGRISAHNVGLGSAIFAVGLFKKMILADWSGGYATPAFDAAAAGTILSPVEAWVGALSYTLQLYFDFSGYSDMAIGLAFIFGVRLPINFSSPYKTTSIIEFWRCWHITLSRFLKNYLYIPLGGNKHGPQRRYTNLFIVMILGGLWHGAGWTFIAWGALHGIFLIINHAWRHLKEHSVRRPPTRLGLFGSWCMTFTAVVFAWVVFRSQDFTTAWSIWQSMLGLNGLLLPDWIMSLSGYSEKELKEMGWHFGKMFENQIYYYQDPIGPWLILTLVVALFFPNTQEFFGSSYPALRRDEDAFRSTKIRWKNQPRSWIAIGVLAGFAFLSITQVQQFLYFQF